MPEVRAGGTKKKSTKKTTLVDSEYRPTHVPGEAKRSPYLWRETEGRAGKSEEQDTSDSESIGAETEVEGKQVVEGEESRPKEMARREESELSVLLRYMMEKEEKQREEERERRREEEERRKAEERVRQEEVERYRAEELERRRRDEERRGEADEARKREWERKRDEENARRREEELRRDRRDLMQEKLKAMGSYKEGTELVDYLGKFERVMKESGVGEEGWAERLFPRLPEGLCARISSVREGGVGYEEVKRVLLKSVGETPLTYGHQLFELTGESMKQKSAGEVCEQILRVCRGVLQGCTTHEECVVSLATALTRKVMPQAGRVYLEGREIQSAEGLRDAWETWMSGRQKGNFYKPWMGDFVGERSGFRIDRREGVTNREVTCFSCGIKGHRAVDCRKGKSPESSSRAVGFRSVTCYSCGKPGHRSTECTNKKVGAPVKKEGDRVAKLVVEGKKDNIAWGLVNGVRCKVLVDSGASVGVIPRELLPEGHEDCGEIHVESFHGTKKMHRSTVVTYEVGGVVRSKLAMIDEREGVTSIVPVSLRDEEAVKAYAQAVAEYQLESEAEARKEAEVKVLTRSQAKAEVELDKCEGNAEVEDLWCTVEESDQEDLGDGMDASVERGEAEPMQECLGESVAEEEVEEEGKVKGLDSVVVSSSELELNQLAEGIGPMGEGSDGKRFRECVLADESLKTWRELGKRNERGFKWEKELLLKGMYVSWEEFVDVIVVPEKFRKRILVMGHEKCGHLGGEKVARLVGKHFIWPGMGKEILEYCASCETCQIKSKGRPRKAPAVDRPVLSEPFESVAVDLVGPLPKGKGGCRFLLTYICLATRWPEAVALRSITAKSVAEGLWCVFSRTAIPEVMLTDQGSQFCGRVVKQLCQLLGVQKVRTSPYHPQTNGTVERMHGTLKSVLGRCIEDKVDWVGQIPLALYVLRQMPHADSGFSPFDLVFGFRVRTPLDALYHGIYETEGKERNVCEWVAGLMDRLERMRDCAALKMSKGKEGRLKYYNKGSKLREFEEGELVLYRIPGMSCKLADSWEGPYKVLKRMGEVNYKIGKIGKELHAKVVHVNCLKKFKEREEVNRLDVVLEEESQERNVLRDDCEGLIAEELEGVMEEFRDVFSDVPGNTARVRMVIDTGDSPPIRQSPYSVPMGIRDAVREELDNLLECGIIERSNSCWASPLVPVKKPRGGIRLCVDFRRLNDITVKEPYYIPGLEELLERVGSGRVLSKVDLAKGFHQVEVVERDREKTCFICPFGKYQYRRMPFGLCNAPSIFQRLMDEVLVGCEEFAKVYIDDILIVSGSWEVHVRHLRTVFGVLSEAGLTCRKSKCVFGKRRLEFLGHVVGDGVMSVPKARVKALEEHPVPRSRKQLRAFLGLIGYYRRFVRDFHEWSSLLTPHTAKTSPGEVQWTSSMLEAFSKLCISLCNHVCLCVPCKEDEFCLECDASASGVGAVLSVKRDGEWKPVAFYSKQLKDAQKRYSAQELEGLALYQSVIHFAFYLYGRRFVVRTDHKSLVWLMLGKQRNRRVYGWALKLSEFQFKVEYRTGCSNVVADDLSRCHGEDGIRDTSLAGEEGGDVGQPT